MVRSDSLTNHSVFPWSHRHLSQIYYRDKLLGIHVPVILVRSSSNLLLQFGSTNFHIRAKNVSLTSDQLPPNTRVIYAICSVLSEKPRRMTSTWGRRSVSYSISYRPITTSCLPAQTAKHRPNYRRSVPRWGVTWSRIRNVTVLYY